MFRPVQQSIHFPTLEEHILSYWKKNTLFERSICRRSKKKQWTFLDGPPFITGLPHYGSLLSSIPKDVFPRYWTMKGYTVRRVWGWDCHGLPAENKVEQTLSVLRKRDIEETVGVERFIQECKKYVGHVSREWEWYIDHVGRWVDFRNAYKTMDTSYMESVMWVFQQMYEKGFIYKGLRVSLYCPHCSTPISNFEVAMDSENYTEITEQASTYKYQLEDDSHTFLLAWSTTPWNKLVTPALAVNPALSYVRVICGSEQYILAKDTLGILSGPYSIRDEFRGRELVGKRFVPHYTFYPIDRGKNAFVVVGGSFVSSDEGTGIVTLAAYGEEDLALMQKENIQIVLHVDDEGMVMPHVPVAGGMYYLKANAAVDEDLTRRGLVYRHDSHTHTVPTCWRCHTRLYYAPQDAWYVNIQRLKRIMKKTNVAVHWHPKHFQNGRYLKSLEAAPDWCISRSRYWGSPVPVWECSCGRRIVPGSIAEIEALSGKTVSDLHKPFIDTVLLRCSSCGSFARRVAEVLDSWIEAGSAVFAERHFPFETREKLEEFFPPDFIVEYTGQIRAWFYVLHVISAALYGARAYNSVLVTGVILGTDGRKMSKNYGNYPDPKQMISTYGGDALRLYLMGSPVMHAEDICISEEEYRHQVRSFLLILWNVYNFFVTYALIDRWKPPRKHTDSFRPTHILDRWILSRLRSSVKDGTDALENFDTPRFVKTIKTFLVSDLSTWYVRRIRDRVGPSSETGRWDKHSAHRTLWTVLVSFSKLIAPVAPFISEEIYRNLTQEESVHLTDWWKHPETLRPDISLERQMARAIALSSRIHAFRKDARIPVRIPLREVFYSGSAKLPDAFVVLVLQETNVSSLKWKKAAREYVVSADASEKNQNLREGFAREIVRSIQMKRKSEGYALDEYILVYLSDWPEEYTDYIRRKTLARRLIRSDDVRVERI